MKFRLGPIEVPGKFPETAIEAKELFALGALVEKGDFKAGIQKRKLSQMTNEKVGVVFEDGENLRVRFEA